MKIWHGCYNSSWNGFITPESFAHPAKFARGLIERIFDYCLERGILKRGDLVGDAFGGIGTGGIIAAYRGLDWRGVELEMRFVKMAGDNFALHRSKWATLGSEMPVIVQGDSRRFDETISGVGAIVSSPPYADSNMNMSNGIEGEHINVNKCSYGTASYGKTPGQIGSLKSGTLDAVVSSPPYAEALSNPSNVVEATGAGGPIHPRNYGQTNGQIGALKSGTLQAVVSSPPYAAIAAGAGGLNTKPAKHAGQQSGRKADSASQDTDQKYGDSDGQISRLKSGNLAAVVSSPPWEESLDRGTVDRNERRAAARAAGISNAEHISPIDMERIGKRNQPDYGATEGQIGQERGETYWQAVSQVYFACYRAIKPGGWIVLVVKDYVSKGKRVPLCDDTARLLEHVGFTVQERVHAMLTEETRHADLFHGETVSKKERKSFFRRLAEKNGSPPIDYEEVLFAQKPL